MSMLVWSKLGPVPARPDDCVTHLRFPLRPGPKSYALRAAVACALAAPACFVGYDSRWGDAMRAQQRLATESAPSAISAATDQAPRAGTRETTFRVRIRPDAKYLAQTVDAPKRIADLVGDANGVLVPAIALKLEIDRIEPWSNRAEDDLDGSLRALRSDDQGQDVDLVVGMIGALPSQTDSLHQLGVAELLGKHIVVRAAGRFGEHDAIDNAFSELSADDRARLVRQRTRHRALAVLLHEIGHSLGALHERDAKSLMNPAYDTKMSGFEGGAVALMRAALAGSDRAALARAQLAILSQGTETQWVPAERDDQVARLRSLIGAPAGAPEQAGVASLRATPPAPKELHGAARDQFARAQQMLQAGAVRAAYDTAKNLFSWYPDVYEVQDLRCQLATVRWLERGELLAECAPIGHLRSVADAGNDGP
jgi:matrixin